MQEMGLNEAMRCQVHLTAGHCHQGQPPQAPTWHQSLLGGLRVGNSECLQPKSLIFIKTTATLNLRQVMSKEGIALCCHWTPHGRAGQVPASCGCETAVHNFQMINFSEFCAGSSGISMLLQISKCPSKGTVAGLSGLAAGL